MLTLGIETSCDETSVALLRDDREIVVDLVASQIAAHQDYGGVVPEIASRQHLEALNPLLAQLQKESGIAWRDLDLIAVTHGPGLIGALLVGVAAAKALSYAHEIPCQPVNHIEGHIASTLLASPELKLPMLCVVVSGGHSDVILMRAEGEYSRLGRTRDDALGEAYDKVARALGAPMPGGPALEKMARAGDARAFSFGVSNLEPSYDFSYSGLKTAAAQAIAKNANRENDVAAAFQFAAVKQLKNVVTRAAREYSRGESAVKTLGLCGGVAANGAVRAALENVAHENGLDFVVPPFSLCTDNAAMIARAGYGRHRKTPREYSHAALNFDVHSLLPIA